MIAKRAGRQQREIAAELGMSDATISRLERGLNQPTAPAARALARWLGWTTDQVLDAAEQAAPTATDGPVEAA